MKAPAKTSPDAIPTQPRSCCATSVAAAAWRTGLLQHQNRNKAAGQLGRQLDLDSQYICLLGTHEHWQVGWASHS